jgi:peptidoglycan hydrolase CwlO-like protein
LQEDAAQGKRITKLFMHRDGVLAVRQEQVVELLSKEGARLKSTALASLAAHARKDPFAKIKQLIQDLVERLIAEATAEATKKGFCDTELGKARKDRDFRLADIKKLNTELGSLEIKKDDLEAELEDLTSAITKLTADLETADKDRKSEKEVNMQTLKDARDGLAAVKEAINVLKVFYKNAAKAAVLAQASPVDEDTDGAGFSGAYKGNQAQSTGIIGLLEVMKSDFERTLKVTDAAEKKSAAEFVKFDRTARSDIGGKETKVKLDKEDLATTKNAIEQGLLDLQSNQDLLDGAVKTIEELKPTCIDTTMSYDERVQKREEELAALNKALCILDTEGVEADCSK